MKDSAPELNVSSSETEEDKEEAKPDGEKDPDFNQVRVEAAFHCHTFGCAGREGSLSCPRCLSIPVGPHHPSFPSFLMACNSRPDFP